MKSKKGIVFGSVVIIVIIILTILIGGHMFKTHSKEEARNHKYEVSLVKALKNSYEGIEEIKISKPRYTEIPGNWHCEIEIIFQDNTVIRFGASYDLDTQEVSDGGLLRQKGQKNLRSLQSKKGRTTYKVIVRYSNGVEQKQ